MSKLKFLFGIAVFLVSVMNYANCTVDMMHLLQGGYDAKVMTVAEMDSVLGERAPQNATSVFGNPAAAKGEEAKGRYRLEWENKQSLFRHSFLADYYLVDTQKNSRIKISDQPVRDAVISPNGKYVVYAKADNNLYIYKVDFKTEVAVTSEENLDIFNGISDWLYEEEFGVTGLFAFSPDSKMLAFVRLDETGVPSFEWQTFLTDDGLYPSTHSLRYPKAGEKNAKASLCVYDLYYKTIRTVELPLKGEYYIPRVSWTHQPAVEKGKEPVPANVVALTMNRDQTKMVVYTANPKSTVAQPFYTEESKTCYVDYDLFNQWQWLSDGRVIVVSEKGGYTQAYLYSAQGIEQKLLTAEKRDVTTVYGYDEKTQTLYYQAATTPMTRQAYALNVKKGITTQLTQGEGTHALRFSKDWKQYIDCYQSVSQPNRYTLWEVKGDRVEAKGTVMDNDSVLQAWKESGLPNKEFFTLTTERGDVLNAWMIKPVGFDAKKKYPVVMMQYSGPASQRVTDSWRKRFGHYLATEGYLVVCVDGRGTNARGREWRNATYMQLGVKEAEDQISAAKYLKTLPYVDGDRMALCGWSYGGYETLMCLSVQGTQVIGRPDGLLDGQSPIGYGAAIWQCGIAIAPVTSWRLYDSAYTERYMRRPQVNGAGYEKADVMNMAENLTGNLLLVHGLADDNVHVQHSWLYVDALVQAGKQFEMQMYVDDNHSIRKPANKEHLHKRILLFLEKNL